MGIMHKLLRLFRFFSVAVLSLTLVGCGAPKESSNSNYVSANQGGVVQHNEVTIRVGPKALSQNTQFQVKKVNFRSKTRPAASQPTVISPVYDVTTAEKTSFDKPIELTLSFEKLEIPKYVERAADSFTLAYFDGKKWVPLKSRVDAERKLVTAEVSHLTPFAIILVPEAVLAVLSALPDLMAIDDPIFAGLTSGSYRIGDWSFELPVYLPRTEHTTERHLNQIKYKVVGARGAIELSRFVTDSLDIDDALQVRIANSSGLWNDALSIGKIILIGDGKLERIFDHANFSYSAAADSSRNNILQPIAGNDDYMFQGDPLTTDDILAALIAHEAAHSILGHWNETMRYNFEHPRIPPNLNELATSLVATILTTGGNPAALLTVVVMSNELQPVPDLELSADNMAIAWTVDAGYNPAGLLFLLDQTTKDPSASLIARRRAKAKLAIARLVVERPVPVPEPDEDIETSIEASAADDMTPDETDTGDRGAEASFDEARVRYILVDISFGYYSFYSSYIDGDENAAEAIRRWDAGVQVSNLDLFDRVESGGNTIIVYKTSQRTIDGLDVELTE